MDMVYSFPDVLSYSALRHPVYNNTQYDLKTEATKQDHHAKNDPKKSGMSKETCPICQERKRRPLAKYIQQKSREERTQDASILEEEEAEQKTPTETHAPGGGDLHAST